MHKGVMGWLLLLCISLVFVSPFFQGKIALTALTNLLQRPSSYSLEALRLGFVLFLYVGLSVFSFWAGFWLWLEDPRAVALAKVYLVFSATVVILFHLLLFAAGWNINLARIIFNRLVYSATWYGYLTFSKRVRNTYYSSYRAVQ